jgi:hypothetical protein
MPHARNATSAVAYSIGNQTVGLTRSDSDPPLTSNLDGVTLGSRKAERLAIARRIQLSTQAPSHENDPDQPTTNSRRTE